MPPETEGEAREWLRFAAEDLRGAQTAQSSRGMAPRHACYLAQQAAEKALKAALVLEGSRPPRHHNLQALAAMLPPLWGASAAGGLDVLTLWANQARYPSDVPGPTRADARLAVGAAADVVETVRADFAARGVAFEEQS